MSWTSITGEIYTGFTCCYVSFFCFILFLLFLNNKNNIPKKHFNSLLLFIILISVGTTLQVLFYGVTYTWSGMMLSLLIVYLIIQDRESSTDFLTEVNNRKQLDHYIKTKINSGRKQEPFSIMRLWKNGGNLERIRKNEDFSTQYPQSEWYLADHTLTVFILIAPFRIIFDHQAHYTLNSNRSRISQIDSI